MCTYQFIHKPCMRGSRGGGGGGGQEVRTPLKNHKNIGFLCDTGPDPLKITKLPSQYSMLGHHRHASQTPFKWRFAGKPMMAPLIHSSTKKNVVKVGPPPPSVKAFWIRACHVSIFVRCDAYLPDTIHLVSEMANLPNTRYFPGAAIYIVFCSWRKYI